MKEIRTVVVLVDGGDDGKEMGDPSGVMEMFDILIGIRIMWVHAIIKTHTVHFNICILYLNWKKNFEK